jgi:hypothetical protein
MNAGISPDEGHHRGRSARLQARTWGMALAFRERGLPMLDGVGVLVTQGVIGIRLWTGHEPDATIMRRALDEVFPT